MFYKKTGVIVMGSDEQGYFIPHNAMTVEQQQEVATLYLAHEMPMPDDPRIIRTTTDRTGPPVLYGYDQGPFISTFPDPAKVTLGDKGPFSNAVRRWRAKQETSQALLPAKASRGQRRVSRDYEAEFWGLPPRN